MRPVLQSECNVSSSLLSIDQNNTSPCMGFPRVRKKSVKTKNSLRLSKGQEIVIWLKSQEILKKRVSIFQEYMTKRQEIQTLIHCSSKITFICNEKYNHSHKGFNNCQISHIFTFCPFLFFSSVLRKTKCPSP